MRSKLILVLLVTLLAAGFSLAQRVRFGGWRRLLDIRVDRNPLRLHE